MNINLATKLMKYPTALGRIVIVIINNVYCIPTYVVWMTILIPLKRLHPDAYYKIEGLFFHWLLAVVSMWSYTAGYDIVEVGDDINECRNKRTLVIANHQSTADVPLLMANFNAKDNILPNIMWIMDRLFKYTNFGIVSIIHQDFFIASGKHKREESIDALRQHLVSSFIKRKRKWMVLFPEGGFLRKRREVSQRYARQHNLPVLQHVTLPRVGAIQAIIDVMCNNSKNISDDNNGKQEQQHHHHQRTQQQQQQEQHQANNNTPNSMPNGDLFQRTLNDAATNKNTTECLLDYVLDITIAYSNGEPLDLLNIVHGMRDSCKTHMLYRLYKISEVPKESNALTEWLYERFVEKNNFLENFYKFGSFYPDGRAKSVVVQQDVLRFLLINLFFITSTYIHYQMICTLVHLLCFVGKWCYVVIMFP